MSVHFSLPPPPFLITFFGFCYVKFIHLCLTTVYLLTYLRRHRWASPFSPLPTGRNFLAPTVPPEKSPPPLPKRQPRRLGFFYPVFCQTFPTLQFFPFSVPPPAFGIRPFLSRSEGWVGRGNFSDATPTGGVRFPFSAIPQTSYVTCTPPPG
jgi:hypothetical protein